MRALLDRVDTTAGCSIKDSFASLDLRRHGFRVLFDAEWIVRRATAASPRVAAADEWEVVRDSDDLDAWADAWRSDGGSPSALSAALLGDPAVDVCMGRRDGRVLCGAVLHESSGAVGISNLFVEAGHPAAGWAGCIHLAERLHPGSVLVGYETGQMLDAARSQGFETVGALRVWLRS